MSADLERRRLAIARALRGDPQPELPQARLRRLEADVAAVRRDLDALSSQLAEVADGAAAPAAYPSDPAFPAAEGDVETPPVPPLEPAGGMSKRAAEALFGY